MDLWKLRLPNLRVVLVATTLAVTANAVSTTTAGAQPVGWFNCPSTIPIPGWNAWFAPYFQIQKDVGGGAVVFRPSTYYKQGNIRLGLSYYTPSPISGFVQTSWLWNGASVVWECKGDYPGPNWLIDVYGWDGYATLPFGEDATPSYDEPIPNGNEQGGGGYGGATTGTVIQYTAPPSSPPSGYACFDIGWNNYFNGVYQGWDYAYTLCFPI